MKISLSTAATAAAYAALALPGASATIYYAGVAESSGEFGAWSATAQVGTGLPGQFGVDYAFISNSGIDVMADQHKINLFRVAFLLERMCPLATGLGSKFDESHFGHFKDAIDYITKTKGAYAILDPHNYMRYNNPSSQPFSGSVIGNSSDPTAATTAQFGAFWGELASRFASDEKVIFGLMNEPHDMPSSLLLANLQAAVDAIRKAGAKNLIIAPGNSWTGGHAWTQGGAEANSAWLHKLVDPLNNTAIDIHEYLDQDFSGGHIPCTQPAATNLAGVTAWLKQHSLKAFITEFGGSNTTACVGMLGDMLDYMAQNEEYIGWTAWAADPCCTDSAQYGSLEPGSTAANGGPSLYDTI
ncbi:glycoside hydrolase superfamily [Lasiosphaeria miniovina]|uniref:cellulase n=1 Tax=Lasiosphaeria miniovina TaxID=1954250 RepID=A0AA40B4U9_9PEZI|nr:glycoside hydrolase superfamily [Lasiosphaeria miniovina]KAK0727751.1 glycoside hydrolase superfamily [Lasiosphaeria miniovina]